MGHLSKKPHQEGKVDIIRIFLWGGFFGTITIIALAIFADSIKARRDKKVAEKYFKAVVIAVVGTVGIFAVAGIIAFINLICNR